MEESFLYYDDNLIAEAATKEVIVNGFDKLQIAIPAFDSSADLTYHAYMPKDDITVVGAKIEFECLTDTNYFEGAVMLYDDTVVLDLTRYEGMSQVVVCDNITYKYALVGMKDDLFYYKAYATTEDFTIIIEYRAVFDEFTTFIDQLY